jgi:tRNA(Ile)-lysidine synthase
MLTQIHAVLERDCRLEPGAPLVVGVSGGPDSLCLLDLLHLLGYAPIVAHFNHGLRPEAEAEAEAVRAMAESRGLPFRLGQSAVAALAEAQGLSIEEAARNARYRFLFELAGQAGAQAVVVGHTADDQVETVLMHLLRGAGLAGLRGMPVRMLPSPWSQVIPLARPLLGVWRAQVLEHCARRGLQPLQDRSNLDPSYFRNRLRHELLPLLESYNPAFRQALWRTAAVLAGDYTLLEDTITAAWGACQAESDGKRAVFDYTALRCQPVALQRHLLRRAAAGLRPGLRDIDFAALERALAFVAQPSTSRQMDWIAGLRLFIEAGRLWLADWGTDLPGLWPQLPEAGSLELPLPGEVILPNGAGLSADQSASRSASCSGQHRPIPGLGGARCPVAAPPTAPPPPRRPLPALRPGWESCETG